MRKISAFLTFIVVFVFVATGFSPVSAVSLNPDFEVLADSVYLVNLDTGTVVYEKNAHKKRPPASITKVMTSIVMLDEVSDLDGTTATATSADMEDLYNTGASVADIRIGETWTMRDYLAAMLIPSGNEAANIVARAVGGTVPDFVDKMNAKAKEIGMNDTHFANPHGLHHENQYSTAYDVYLMAKFAMQNQSFRDTVSKTRYTLPATELTGERLLITTNRMMEVGTVYYYEPVTGIKTGYLPEAGRCIVSTATLNGYNYLCVVLGAPTADKDGKDYDYNMAFFDTVHLYEWAFDHFGIKQILNADNPIDEAKVKFGKNKDFVHVIPKENFTTLLPSNVSAEDIQKIVHLPEEPAAAPIQKGDALGSIELKLAGETIGEIPLIASEDVAQSKLLYYLDLLKRFFSSLWVKIILCIVAVSIAFYVIYAVVVNTKQRKYKKIKRRKKF